MTEMIDAWTHIFPATYFERLKSMASATGPLKRWMNLPSLFDLDVRFRHMDQFEGYRQLLTPSMPPVEELAGRAEASDMASLMNEGLAELVLRYPGRFAGWVGAVSLLDPERACREVERVAGMEACGIQLPTNIRGKALDDPAFEDVFAAINERGLGIWLHPIRSATPDYPGEEKSRYEIWWCFGWPHESSVAMARLVFSGIFDRYPKLRIVTHHMGAMIPFFEGRIRQGWGLEMGARTPPGDSHLLPGKLNRDAIDYFRMFFADTALSGSDLGVRCGLDFFGGQHVVFATDYPFDAEGGTFLIRETKRSVENLGLAGAARKAVFADNLRNSFLLPSEGMAIENAAGNPG